MLLARADALLAGLNAYLSADVRSAVERWRADSAAALFHLGRPSGGALPVVVVIGGTGTGKSTLVNRLLQADVTATSFRRTYTSGAVAIVRTPQDLPAEWLGVEHMTAAPGELPVRGRGGTLVLALNTGAITPAVVLVDTPDLDGDQPAHHAEADRAFRWAQGIVFLVTPEKYQMTELLPYYRLASRYDAPALFVMNKCEEQAAVEDYRRLLGNWTRSDTIASTTSVTTAPSVFAIPRDDAAFQPAQAESIDALRSTLQAFRMPDPAGSERGLRARGNDLLGRLADQVVAPLRAQEGHVNQLIAALRAMETPPAGVDVNPLTQQLQRRLQQRSVLYLMGPQRILDRVRQAPSLLVRLPRAAWDYLRHGQIDPATLQPSTENGPRDLPDFAAILGDQFAIVQSRIDDVVRGGSGDGGGGSGVEIDEASYAAARIDPEEARKIAGEELAELRAWLEKRWNATPRDTRALQALLKYLPGGAKLTRWSEAAPYLLTLIVVTHHAFFGHIDLLVIGGFSLATWLSERLSNEVAAQTRATNQRIEERFARLAHAQITRVCDWLRRQTPSPRQLGQLESVLAEWEG